MTSADRNFLVLVWFFRLCVVLGIDLGLGVGEEGGPGGYGVDEMGRRAHDTGNKGSYRVCMEEEKADSCKKGQDRTNQCDFCV